MIIVDPEVDDAGVKLVVTRVTDLVQADAGRVATLDNWGRRRFTHPLKRKNEGTYLVFEIVTPATSLDPLDRNLRLADEIIRHKIIRLPDRHRFRVDLTEAIEPPRDADGKIDIEGTMQAITSVVEGWVREYPEQWLWVHRRWR